MTQISQPLAVVRAVPISGHALEIVGHVILRYGLALFLVTGGLAKFTSAEAAFIQPLMAHSPFFAWLYGVGSVQGASNVIGVIEIILGVLLAVHRWWPWLAAIGGLGASLECVFTLSFLITTPNLSPEMMGFLSKDVLLFGAAVWATGESLRVVQGRSAR
jgi:reactive chlorine resistance protein C